MCVDRAKFPQPFHYTSGLLAIWNKSLVQDIGERWKMAKFQDSLTINSLPKLAQNKRLLYVWEYNVHSLCHAKVSLSIFFFK